MVQTRLPTRYKLLEEVGQGGMAVVYRAQDEALHREVAVKVLHAHLLSEPESKARLEREARAVAKLQHDNILQIYDYSGGDSPASYIVTEFIEGQTLKQFLATRKLPVPELAALVSIEVGNALRHAHSLGIIHRDLKPENVMVRKDGFLKLMDFGVAQIMDLERMTVTGQLLGSPAYMAPELLEGKLLDVRTDVFSMGIMLFQMATGALPFSGRNPHEVLRRIAEGKFADPRTINRLVSDQLSRIIIRALAKQPQDRFPDITAMLDELRAYVTAAGFANPREELRRFFTDPEAFEKELVPRMAAALVASGQRERAEGHTAKALELWNRALALEPENRVVLKELRRLEGGRRLRRAVVLTVGGLGIAVATTAVFRLARPEAPAAPAIERPEPAPPAAAELVPPPAVVAPPAPVAKEALRAPARVPVPPTRLEGAAPGRHHADHASAEPAHEARERRGPSPEARPVKAASDPIPIPEVQFTLITNVRTEVLVDGQSRGHFGHGNNKLAVAWDRPHELVLRNQTCCADRRYTIGPGAARPPGDRLDARLEPKPAFLRIKVTPARPGVTLLVSDDMTAWKTPALPGQTITIPFDADGDMRKSLEVTAFAGGKTVRTKVPEISAGQTVPVEVRLDE